MLKELACQYMTRGFDPWSEKIPEAVEQLSPRAASAEPVPQSRELQLLKRLLPRARALQHRKPRQ